MRILLLNPNTTSAITALVAATARAAASPGTEIVEATAHFGPAIIGSRAENAIAAHAALEAAVAATGSYDAVVLAVSLDTALEGMRELLHVPVVGLTEAALIAASLVSRRAALITLGPRLVAVYGELIAHYGFSSRVPIVDALSQAPKDFFDRPAEAESALRDVCERTVQRGAEAIVLAGAVFAGRAAAVQPSIDVPVIDGVPAAIALAEMLVRLQLPKATVGSLAALQGRSTTGLAPVLANRLLDPT